MSTLTLKKTATITEKPMRRDHSNISIESEIGMNTREDIIGHLASLAERGAGYKPGRIGWLAWFGQILRGEKGLLQNLCKTAKQWPPLEREIFELYYIDRMALDDIARVIGCTANAFHAHLLFIQRRLREALIREVLAESKQASNEKLIGRLRCGKCGRGSREHLGSALSIA